MSQVITPDAALYPQQNLPEMPRFTNEKKQQLDSQVSYILNILNHKNPEGGRFAAYAEDEHGYADLFAMTAHKFQDLRILLMYPEPDRVFEAGNTVCIKFADTQVQSAYVLANVLAKEIIRNQSKQALRVPIESDGTDEAEETFEGKYLAQIFFDMSYSQVPTWGKKVEGPDFAEETNPMNLTWKYSNGSELAKLTYLFLDQIDYELCALGDGPMKNGRRLVDQVEWVSISNTHRTEDAVNALDKVAEVKAPGFGFASYHNKNEYQPKIAYLLTHPGKITTTEQS